MLPEVVWSRLHVDHAINFMGSNWLVMVDALSKYPCIHQTSSVSAKSTIEILEVEFAHFGYPHTVVTDNAATFTGEEFQEWCRSRGITHLKGAPYHPATNGQAERLVQTFKQALRKSTLPPRAALQEFLMQYRRTPDANGYSPSELLHGRRIRTKVDTLFPSPAHTAEGRQSKAVQPQQQQMVAAVACTFQEGDACYAKYYGPRRDRTLRWVPAVVTRRLGSRTFIVKVAPCGPRWKRHIDQLQRRYTSEEDLEPAEDVTPDSRTVPCYVASKEEQRPKSSENHPETNLPRRSRRPRQPRRYFDIEGYASR